MTFWILLLPQALLADDSCSASPDGDCAASLLQLKLNERKEYAQRAAVEDGAADAAHRAHREARARAVMDATFWWKSRPAEEDKDEELDSTVKGKGGAPEKTDAMGGIGDGSDAEGGEEGNETLSDGEEGEGNETLSEEEKGESNETLSDDEEGEEEGESEAESEEGESEEAEEESDASLEEMEHAKAEDEAQEKIEEKKEAERHEEELEAAEDHAVMDEVNPAEHGSATEEESTSAAEIETAHPEDEEEEVAHELRASETEHETGHETEHETEHDTEHETEHETEDETEDDMHHTEDLSMIAAHADVPAGSKAGQARGSKHAHAEKPIRRAPAGEGLKKDPEAS